MSDVGTQRDGTLVVVVVCDQQPASSDEQVEEIGSQRHPVTGVAEAAPLAQRVLHAVALHNTNQRHQ